jgi:hypothetical protein
MEHLRLDRNFATAILACNTFGHLLDRFSQAATLAGIYRHLDPGGQLLLHIAASFEALTRPTRTPYRPCAEEHTWFCCDDRVAAADQSTGLVDLQWVYEFVWQDGRCEKRILPVTLRFTPAEALEALLIEAGFCKVEQLSGDPSAPLTPDTLMIAARK